MRFFLAAASFATAAGAAEIRAHEAAALCREALSGPFDAKGGWFYKPGSDGNVLCLTGTLEGLDPSTLTERVADESINVLVVRSAGGPADTWLDVAEAVEDRVATLVVDEVCFSSCAIYAMPLPAHTVVRQGSLVLWHGGPSTALPANVYGDASDADTEAYHALAERTDAFLSRNGVSPAILADSSRSPERPQLELAASLAPEGRQIAGYAFSPDRLHHCYGFPPLEHMWHAGSNAALIALAQARSRDLIVLEAPITNETGSCR